MWLERGTVTVGCDFGGVVGGGVEKKGRCWGKGRVRRVGGRDRRCCGVLVRRMRRFMMRVCGGDCGGDGEAGGVVFGAVWEY